MDQERNFDIYQFKNKSGQKLKLKTKLSKCFHYKRHRIMVFGHLIICIVLILKTFCPVSAQGYKPKLPASA